MLLFYKILKNRRYLHVVSSRAMGRFQFAMASITLPEDWCVAAQLHKQIVAKGLGSILHSDFHCTLKNQYMKVLNYGHYLKGFTKITMLS